ncbi:MAG: hypothetical protein Q8O00_09320, partial [Holophaga sp.]|nr:hypothetical protein [Holophaga sp.]
PGDLEPNTAMQMIFSLDGMRFDTPVRFLKRDGYLRALLTVPEQVLHAERRGKMRARFGPREKASCTVLEGFFDGKGATGRLVNLSMEGLCIRIDRAISIQDNHKLGITPELFEAGTALPMIRIQNLPHTPTVECSGIICYLRHSPIGVLMGVRLEGLGGLETQHLHQVMARRLPSFAKGFPVKHRRAAMELENSLEAPSELEESWDVSEENEASSEPEEALATQQTDSLQAARPDTHERLLQIKKRGKRIMIIIKDDLDRAILGGTLQVDGFRLIQEAQNMIEVLRFCRTTPPELILMEQQVGTVSAHEFLGKLKRQGHCTSVPVILIAEAPDLRTALMAKAAGFAYVQPSPVNYDGELKAVIHKWLNLD